MAFPSAQFPSTEGLLLAQAEVFCDHVLKELHKPSESHILLQELLHTRAAVNCTSCHSGISRPAESSSQKQNKKELLNLFSFYFMDPVVDSGICGWIFPRLQPLPAGGACPFEWSPAGLAASSSKSLKAGERREGAALQTLLPCLLLPPSGVFPLHPCSTQFLGIWEEIGPVQSLAEPSRPSQCPQTHRQSKAGFWGASWRDMSVQKWRQIK